MRKYLILFLLISFPVFASDNEAYLVERPGGGVSIVNYKPGGKDSLSDVLHSFGFDNYPIKALKEEDIPPTKEDRNFWIKDAVTKKVVVDFAKKQAEQRAQIQAEDEAEAILAKLKITKEEFEKIGKLNERSNPGKIF